MRESERCRRAPADRRAEVRAGPRPTSGRAPRRGAEAGGGV